MDAEPVTREEFEDLRAEVAMLAESVIKLKSIDPVALGLMVHRNRMKKEQEGRP